MRKLFPKLFRIGGPDYFKFLDNNCGDEEVHWEKKTKMAAGKKNGEDKDEDWRDAFTGEQLTS